jgi:hypothetical protein
MAFGDWPDVAAIRLASPAVTGDGAPGITGVTAEVISAAAELDLVIKLVAYARRAADGVVGAAVVPVAIPADESLARIGGVTNVVELVGLRSAGSDIGSGLAAKTTSSAVLGDLHRHRPRTRLDVGRIAHGELDAPWGRDGRHLPLVPCRARRCRDRAIDALRRSQVLAFGGRSDRALSGRRGLGSAGHPGHRLIVSDPPRCRMLSRTSSSRIAFPRRPGAGPTVRYPPPLAHSVRSYCWGAAIAAREGWAFDRRVLWTPR